MFTSFQQTEAYLNRLVNYERTSMPRTEGPPDFSRLTRAMNGAGLWKAPPPTVLIAGTKGKGSTLIYLEALLTPVCRVVSFSSPHLVSVRERIRISGEPISEESWIEGFNELYFVLEHSKKRSEPLTYFETLFLLYLWTMFHSRAEVALIEVGLGGTYDCTNILTPTISVLTPIDYDHTEILGNNLMQIARDKAGIIKPRRPVVIGRQGSSVKKELRRVAAQRPARTLILNEDFTWREEKNSTWSYIQGEQIRYSNLKLHALGKHQRDNATVALRVVTMFEKMNLCLKTSEVRDRLKKAHLPGRMELQESSPPVLLDVAHNPASFRALAEVLRDNFRGKKTLLIAGIQEQKDYRACLRCVFPYISEAIFVRLSHPRSRSPSDLAAFASTMGITAETAQNECEAFERMRSQQNLDLIIIAGSFVLAGAYLNWRAVS